MKKMLLIGILLAVGSLVKISAVEKNVGYEVNFSNRYFDVGDDVGHIALPYQMTVTSVDDQNNVTCNFLDQRMIYQERVFKASELIKLPQIQDYIPNIPVQANVWKSFC